MSRVGKKIIIVPKNVEVKIDGNLVVVKSDKGELKAKINPVVTIVLEEKDGEKSISFKIKNETNKNERAQWGTAQAIVENMVLGVTQGFSKQLEVEGVGFRVNLNGNKLILTVGFSHDVEYELPSTINAVVEKNTITISGIDKQLVGHVAAKIRKIRKPEPYKGKGIHYVGEHIRRKAGKTAKSSE
ncbi:MAG: 50S ribosomal protein L6 [Patescibacteria group bacterium]